MKKITAGSHSDLFLTQRSGVPIAIKKFTVISGSVDHKKALFERLILENIHHPNLISSDKIRILQKPVQVALHSQNSYGPRYVELPELQYEIEMEYLRKGSLDKYLSILYRDNSVQGAAIEIFRELLAGLDHLHSHQVVHGSIKPDNILIQENGSIKLADFGDSALIKGAQKVFGVAAKELLNSTDSHVTQYDDLRFQNRPTPSDGIQLYNFFAAFELGDMDEENIGLIALFNKLFKMRPGKSKTIHRPIPEDFYNTMVMLEAERATSEVSICKRLLKHPFMQQKTTKVHLIMQRRIVFGGNIAKHPIHERLVKLYSKEGIERFRKLDKLFSQLLQQTQTGRWSELTKRPLKSRPPIGFQESLIEFPLRKISGAERDHFNALMDKFLIHLLQNNRIDALKEALRLSSEVYKLMKRNGDPTKDPSLYLDKGQKSLLQDMLENGRKIILIYGPEKPALKNIYKVPRAYVTIDGAKANIVIAFMGAEVFPRLPETWWTNDRQNQAEIWAKVNFNHSSNRHKGIIEYSEKVLSDIEHELAKSLSNSKGRNIQFRITGHSTGGVLGIRMCQRLKILYPESEIHAIVFGTPSFMNQQECEALQAQFPNNSRYSIFNIISLLDPALGIYGPCFQPPFSNTVFIIPSNFYGESFLDVHAATKRVTLENINNHSIDNYRVITSELLEKISRHPLAPSASSKSIPSKL